MNYSERFTAIMSETDPNSGNSPHRVAESIRENGLVEEKDLPFSEDIKTPEQYYQPDPMRTSLLVKGKRWTKQYLFKHEWVWNGNPLVAEKVRLLKEALKRSPVGASVYAWNCDANGIYQKSGEDNHWVCIYGWNDHGWKIFDSYTNSYKLYSFDADISMAKLYWLSKAPSEVDNWDIAILKSMVKFIKDLIYKNKNVRIS